MNKELKVPRLEKELMVNELIQRFNNSKHIVVTNFNKLGMAKLQTLRRLLKNSSSEYIVVKNSIALAAFKTVDLEKLTNLLTGTVGIGFSSNDPIEFSRAFVNFSKDNETFNVLGGYIEGEFLDFARVKEMADMPSKETLIGRLLGVINSPVYGLHSVLNGILRQFVVVLTGIKKKK